MTGRITLHETTSGWVLKDQDDATITIGANPLAQAMALSISSGYPLDVAGKALTVSSAITLSAMSSLTWTVDVGVITFSNAINYCLVFTDVDHCFIDFKATIVAGATNGGGGAIVFSPQVSGDMVLDSTFKFHRVRTNGNASFIPVYFSATAGPIQRCRFEFGEIETDPIGAPPIASGNNLIRVDGNAFTSNEVVIDQGLHWLDAAVRVGSQTHAQLGNNRWDLNIETLGTPTYGFFSYSSSDIVDFRLNGNAGIGIKLNGSNNSVRQGANQASTPVQDSGIGNIFL